MNDIGVPAAAAASEDVRLSSFGTDVNAVVVGATGGIGRALVEQLRAEPSVANVVTLSRSAARRGPAVAGIRVDLIDETTLERAAGRVADELGTVHLVVVATGILHALGLQPEKTWRSLDSESLRRAFAVNTIGPALVAKHFLPLLPRDRKSAFAALSARVGSIGDNHLGGWHAYRASKAALNMLIRNFAIELARRNRHALCVGLHPGTVDTRLSAPFQRTVPEDALFTPERSAASLLRVLDRLTPDDSGGVFAWDGQRVPE